MRTPKSVVWAAAVVIVLTSCGDTSTPDETDRTGSPAATDRVPDTTADAGSATAAVAERMEDIDRAVSAWRASTTVAEAHAAAETAANLVVGPNGPGYGDRDGDGVVGGASTVGLLPGLEGTPAGLATPLSGNDCVANDVLGGSWTDPGSEWQAMLTAIGDWRVGNNTMPSLASHPMRIVGWATFTLRSDSLDDAHEYGGHAKLHVDVSVRALGC